jgi:hypothetical protein
MVNVGLNVGSLLGIVLAAAGAALYFLRSQRPALARDHDIFFAAVALLSGGILFFQGWRLDPILQFLQVLLAGSAVFYAYDGIRLRGVATQQAKRSAPIVDDDRPVSRVYRAELDELNVYEDRPARRRIPGTREVRPNRDEFDEGVSRRSSNRINGEDRIGSGDRSRRRPRPRPERDSSDYEGSDDLDIREDRPLRSRGTSARSGPQSSGSSRSRRPRPLGEESGVSQRRSRNSDVETPSSEYVDYRPVDDEEDNWGNY